MRTTLVALMLFVPLSAGAADKTKLRSSLSLAYARAYSVCEVLGGAEKAYSIACKDEKSFTHLMMIDLMISYALETKSSIAGDLAAAAAEAAPDAAAREIASALVSELGSIAGSVAKIMAPAKRCEDHMKAKDSALDAADPDGDDMTWDAARQHASINVRRLGKFDATAEIKAARALVEKTKKP